MSSCPRHCFYIKIAGDKYLNAIDFKFSKNKCFLMEENILSYLLYLNILNLLKKLIFYIKHYSK